MRARKKKLAQHLRNNMTKPEVFLWVQIQNDQLGFRIKRQYSFGPYILDNYCSEVRVAIEIDGSIHNLKEKKDEIRDAWLATQGVEVFRIPAKTILRSPLYAASLVKDFLEARKAEMDDNRDTSLEREVGERGSARHSPNNDLMEKLGDGEGSASEPGE